VYLTPNGLVVVLIVLAATFVALCVQTMVEAVKGRR
jgi:hypothetical protein